MLEEQHRSSKSGDSKMKVTAMEEIRVGARRHIYTDGWAALMARNGDKGRSEEIGRAHV